MAAEHGYGLALGWQHFLVWSRDSEARQFGSIRRVASEPGDRALGCKSHGIAARRMARYAAACATPNVSGYREFIGCYCTVRSRFESNMSSIAELRDRLKDASSYRAKLLPAIPFASPS